MNQDQEFARQMALSGHSFLLTGEAGTGKTFTTKEIIASLKESNKEVLLCSSTGISCMPYADLNCQTLHKAFGLKDGRYEPVQMRALFKDSSDIYYATKAQTIKHSDVLVIDEISMVSSRTLNLIDHVCRSVLGIDKPMGGLQCIFTGDFLQLPPVPSPSIQDPGQYCFKHPLFQHYVPHTVMLSIVVRQDDSTLITAINELAHGNVSATNVAFIRSLQGHLDGPAKSKRVLFATNIYADIYNREMVMEMEGDAVTYDAKDTGLREHLNKFHVEKELLLKIGAPVMLLMNMSDTLVNGLIGVVEKLTAKSVTVHFNHLKISKVFTAESFTREFYWANYSTSLGASLHELGHTFDLAHTPTGVMARGFDDLYRMFTVQPLVSRSASTDSSRIASPIPYSPKQSPIHRPRLESGSGGNNSRSGSPKPCPLSRPRLRSDSGGSGTSVIQIETAFKKLHVQSTQKCNIKNYDGSEMYRTTLKHKDGTETVTEVTVFPSGEKLTREVVKNPSTGKSRTTMSMSASGDNLAQLAAAPPSTSEPASSSSSSSGVSSLNTSASSMSTSTSSTCSSTSGILLTASPKQLPRSPEDHNHTATASSASSSSSTVAGGSTAPPVFTFQEVRYRDGGAHWYRSSAVLLHFHKWFNPKHPEDPNIPPKLNGSSIECHSGLRLVELRSVPEGVVFHHWEFLTERPPTVFRLKYSEISTLSPTAVEFTVLAEDTFGNVMKKKFSMTEIQSLDSTPVTPTEKQPT